MNQVINQMKKLVEDASSAAYKTFDPNDNMINPLPVERLLDQASTLIERCLSLREHIFELEEKNENMLADIKNLTAQTFNLENEIDAIQRFENSNFHDEEDYGGRLIDHYNEAARLAQEAIRTRQLGEPEHDDFVAVTSEMAGKAAFKNNTRVEELSEDAQKRRFSYELHNAEISLKQIKALIENSAHRRALAANRKKHAEDSQSIRTERLVHLRSRLDHLKQLQERIGGALNYIERAKHAGEIFEQDLSEAVRRTEAAHRGLKIVYDTSLPLPEFEGSGFIDQLAIWIRKATTKVLTISQTDTIQIVTVSLKDRQTSEDEFKSSLLSGTVNFSFKPEDFPEQGLVRIRNIALFTIIDTQQPDVISMTLNNQDLKYNYALPSARFGSVPIRSYEVFGLGEVGEHYLNASPIGNWSVSVEPKSVSQRYTISDIVDIQVEIEIVSNSI